MSTFRQESGRQSNDLLLAYLQTDDRKESESLLTDLLARAAPVIEKRLGRRLRVSIRGGRCPFSPDAEDQYAEVNALLVQKLRKLKTGSSENPIRDFEAYVEQIAENAFRNGVREDHKRLRSLKDALRYLLSGRTQHKLFGLWRSENGKQVGGLAEWRDEGRALTRTRTYQQVLDDPAAFARAKLPHEDIQHLGRAELVIAVLGWVGGPVEFDDLVKVIATLQRVREPFVRTLIGASSHESLSEDDQSSIAHDAPDQAPSPLAALEFKSDMQMVWGDLCRLTLDQRRALLLQAQHDVIEILLRSGVATIREIAATLEMGLEEIEQLRAAGFLSDAQLGRRFSSLRATIMQQRNRARHKMAEWRKRW